MTGSSFSAAALWEDPRVVAGMEAQMALRRARLAAGEEPLGWKLAFSAPPLLEELGIGGPLVGFLNSGTRLEDGAEISLAGWTKAAAEPEIAVHIGSSLAAGSSREQAQRAIAGLGLAIEIADVDVPRTEVEPVLAGDIYHRHVILAPPDRSREGGDTAGVAATVRRNGEVVAATDEPEAATGDLVDLIRHVADLLPGAGCALEAGQVVIAGAIVPLIWVEPGDRIRYESAQLGALEVGFSS